jgi:hydrogenase-1 operon protein HyaE
MSLATDTDSAGSQALVKLPVQAPAAAHSAVVERLVKQFGASWVDESNIDTWAAEGGNRVLLFTGDPVQFPEGLDVAAVLPELQRCVTARFSIGVVLRAAENALARRYGSQRWPTLLFLRDGKYVTTLSGMHDWDVFLQRMTQALAMPVSRAPSIGIAVVSATAGGASCH